MAHETFRGQPVGEQQPGLGKEFEDQAKTPELEPEPGLGKEFEDQPGLVDISDLISEDTYLDVMVKRTEKQFGDTPADQTIAKILSGEAEDEARLKADAANKKVLAEIQKLGGMFLESVNTETAVKAIEEEIEIMRQVTDAELMTKINPATDRSYTREEWNANLRKLQLEKEREVGIRPSEEDVFGTLATQLFGIIFNDPELVVGVSSIPYQRQRERFEQHRNAQARKFNAEKDAQILKIERFVKNSDFQQLWLQNERINKHRVAQAVMEIDNRNTQLKDGIKNGDWRAVLRESNDILNGMRLLPSAQLDGALRRYNNLAGFANKQNPELQLKVFTDKEMKGMVNERSGEEREQVIRDINDDIYKQKKTWDGLTPADRRAIETYLKTKGTFYNPATGEQEPLGIEDVAITALAFRGKTAATRLAIFKQERIEDMLDNKQTWQERQNDLDRAVRLDVANIAASSRIAVARENMVNKFRQVAGGGFMTGEMLDSIKSRVNDAAAEVLKQQSELNQFINIYNNRYRNAPDGTDVTEITIGKDPDTGEPMFMPVEQFRAKIRQKVETNNVYSNEIVELFEEVNIGDELAYNEWVKQGRIILPGATFKEFEPSVLRGNVYGQAMLEIRPDGELVITKLPLPPRPSEFSIQPGGSTIASEAEAIAAAVAAGDSARVFRAAAGEDPSKAALANAKASAAEDRKRRSNERPVTASERLAAKKAADKIKKDKEKDKT